MQPDTPRESHPLSLLMLTSTMLPATDPREADPLAAARAEPEAAAGRDQLIASLLEVRRPETSALLTALAELVDDELTARRITRELADRPHKPPRWLRRLTPLRIDRAIEMGHVLGDGDNLLLDVVTGSDHHLAVAAYIDHNLGTVVKDAFVVPEALSTLLDRFAELTENEPDTSFAELDPADARAKLTEAIELGAITYPPFETETWPACSPATTDRAIRCGGARSPWSCCSTTSCTARSSCRTRPCGWAPRCCAASCASPTPNEASTAS